MIKNLFLILFFILFANCSFYKTGFWTKEEKIVTVEKNNKLFEKEETLANEFNPNIKIKLSLDRKYSNKINFNNFGPSKINLTQKKISKLKFKKIDYFDQFEPELLFYKNDIILFEKNGTLVRFGSDSEIIWKVNHYNKNEKKIGPILKLTNYKDKILVTDSLSKIHLIDTIDGSLLWSNEHRVSFISQIKIDNDKFYALDANNTFNCFSLKDGNKLWEFKTEEKLINSQKQTSIVIDKDKVIFNNSKGEIIALDKDSGNLIWITPSISFDESFQSFLLKSSDLVLDNENLYISNNRNNFYSLDVNTGLVNWRQNINSSLRSVIIDNVIFTISDNGYLFVIEKDTGNIVRSTNILSNFKQKKRDRIKLTGFLVSSDKIYLTSNNGLLILINIEDGKQDEIFKVSREKISKPYVNNESLYIVKDDQIIKIN